MSKSAQHTTLWVILWATFFDGLTPGGRSLSSLRPITTRGARSRALEKFQETVSLLSKLAVDGVSRPLELRRPGPEASMACSKIILLTFNITSDIVRFRISISGLDPGGGPKSGAPRCRPEQAGKTTKTDRPRRDTRRVRPFLRGRTAEFRRRNSALPGCEVTERGRQELTSKAGVL